MFYFKILKKNDKSSSLLGQIKLSGMYCTCQASQPERYYKLLQKYTVTKKHNNCFLLHINRILGKNHRGHYSLITIQQPDGVQQFFM